MKTLVLGGARSGKSAFAEKLAAESGLEVTYIATAQVYDAEFAERIRVHQSRRPSSWRIVEEPFYLAETLKKYADPNRCLVVDCLTLWLAQWICEDCHPPANKRWEDEREQVLAALHAVPGSIVLVSNEVGMGIVPMGEINRRFQDEQGRLNQAVATVCDQAVFVAAGLPLWLKGRGS